MWVRTDDSFTDWTCFDALTFAARWHYMACVHACARTRRYDGYLRAVDVRRASDVPDPDAAISSLVEAGLLEAATGGYRVTTIDQHLPPPHMRDEARKASQRERQRRHREKSTVTGDITRDVTRDTGTGQDGPGPTQGTEVGDSNEQNDDTSTSPASLPTELALVPADTPCDYCRGRGHFLGCKECGKRSG